KEGASAVRTAPRFRIVLDIETGNLTQLKHALNECGHLPTVHPPHVFVARRLTCPIQTPVVHDAPVDDDGLGVNSRDRNQVDASRPKAIENSPSEFWIASLPVRIG